MKVLIAVKRVVDYNVKVRVKPDHTGVDLVNVKMSINPFDEIAVEESVRLLESGQAKELIVVSIGPLQAQETLRSALALGVDRGILVQTDETVEPLHVAKILKVLVEREKPDLILLGKQAIDDDCNQTGQMLGALLGWPQGTFISKLVLQNSEAIVTREVDGGHETLKISLPAVITTDLRLNVPRYPKLPNIMKAKQKPLEILSLETLGIVLSSHHKILKVAEPQTRKAGIKVKDVADLVHHLHEEARII
ncbi:electron transfer flavoprotein subunit beta [Caedimonas varicaedens]|jgi:electron transfer flavoprotein beta subunit|uniref:Electron transfer flavoprotein subunit beta n=1 Tax=Caedimonas varicaedens TaxID=1629334 RepID=A0A0K8MCL2_9PROT|nr:electron transfer flavoprotein subunit beta [Caedimonas varicaedens]